MSTLEIMCGIKACEGELENMNAKPFHNNALFKSGSEIHHHGEKVYAISSRVIHFSRVPPQYTSDNEIYILVLSSDLRYNQKNSVFAHSL